MTNKMITGAALASILCLPLMNGTLAGAHRSSRSVDPHDFVSHVDNRYFPLRPGTTLRYEGVAERKYYAAGIGEIKSQDVSGDHEAFVLVAVSH